MAYATNAIDLNRGTNGLTLPADLAAEVIQNTQKQSAVMQLAPQITLPGRGTTIPVVLGDAVASIVAESTEKPVSEATVATRLMRPYKFALIEVFSNEFKRDLGALYDALAQRLPGSIAKAFDQEVLTGTTTRTGFDNLSGATPVTGASDVITGIKTGFSTVAASGFRVDGLAISPAAYTSLMLTDDANKRPLFYQSATEGGPIGKVFGANVAETDASIDVIGGDWSMTRWGMVNDIDIAISDQATVNNGTEQIHLWQRNCFALRVECEMSFVCVDTDAFFKLEA